jgi:hypothetical protein
VFATFRDPPADGHRTAHVALIERRAQEIAHAGGFEVLGHSHINRVVVGQPCSRRHLEQLDVVVVQDHHFAGPSS